MDKVLTFEDIKPGFIYWVLDKNPEYYKTLLEAYDGLVYEAQGYLYSRKYIDYIEKLSFEKRFTNTFLGLCEELTGRELDGLFKYVSGNKYQVSSSTRIKAEKEIMQGLKERREHELLLFNETAETRKMLNTLYAMDGNTRKFREYSEAVNHDISSGYFAICIYTLGYIAGKRAERARRKHTA